MKHLTLIVLLLPELALCESSSWGLQDVNESIGRITGAISSESMREGLLGFLKDILRHQSDDCARMALQVLEERSVQPLNFAPAASHCDEAKEMFLHHASKNMDEGILRAGRAYLNRFMTDPCNSAIRHFLGSLLEGEDELSAIKDAASLYLKERELIPLSKGCEASVKNLLQKHGDAIRKVVYKNSEL